MNKDEYLRLLKNKLNELNIDGKDEILNDFTNHFEIGHQNGLSDEELIENLGSIDEVLESYESLPKQEKIIIDHHEQKKEFTDKITCLDISAKHADTKVLLSSDNSFKVELYKEGKLLEKLSHMLTAYQEESIFYVKVLPIFPYKSFGNYELTIRIPNNLEKIKLSTSSGDVDLNNIDVDLLDIQSASGDINLHTIHTKKLSLEVASSDIDIKHLTGDLDIRSANGDIEIDQTSGDNLSFKNASGDLNIHADYKHIQLTNVSGDVNVEFKTVEQMKVNTTSGDINIRIDNNDNLSVETHSLSGDCDVYLKGEEVIKERNKNVVIGEPNTQIKLNTVSGDIHLDMA